MKKLMIVLTALFTMTITANAMSYEQARDQALFLTDKMAYELNLTEDQYEAAFEINLDYLMSVETVDDLYSTYWTRRNLDLSYILLDWQYRAFVEAAYFYRPLYWDAGFWHFGIYARYPHRTYFYFGRPHFYLTYRGGHSWRMNGGRSWYHGRTFGAVHRNARDMRGFGMRNGFDRGDFRNKSGNFVRNQGSRGLERSNGGNFSSNRGGNFNGARSGNMGNNSRSVGTRSGNDNRYSRSGSFGQRESSTRTTVGSRSNFSGNDSRSSSSVSRGSTSRGSVSTPNRTFSPSRGSSSSMRSSSPAPSRSSSSFGSSSSRSSSSFSSSPSRSSSSSSRGSSMSSGSRGGSSHSSGGSRGGGGHFGGHR